MNIYVLEISFIKFEERMSELFLFQTKEDIPFQKDGIYTSYTDLQKNFLDKICDINFFKERPGFCYKFTEKNLLTF